MWYSAKAYWDNKKISRYSVLSMFLICWASIAVSALIDDDLFFIMMGVLFFAIIGSIIALLVFHFATSKLEIGVLEDGIFGSYYFGKSFSLAVNGVQSVQSSGINGIKIIARNGKTYKFNFIKNREMVCTEMRKIGIVVDERLVYLDNTIIISKPDRKKQKLFKFISIASIILSNISITISAVWYHSDYNLYATTQLKYYHIGYEQIPFEIPTYRIRYWPEELPTTHIAIAFLAIFLVFVVLYFIFSNNQVSVNHSTFRGVNGFGKVTMIPFEQITNTKIASACSSISINRMGKVHKFYWIINNVLICAAINEIKTENQKNTVYEAPIQNSAVDVSNTEPKVQVKATTDTIEEIRQLKALFDDGIISEEEFEAKKKQLLNI